MESYLPNLNIGLVESSFATCHLFLDSCGIHIIFPPAWFFLRSILSIFSDSERHIIFTVVQLLHCFYGGIANMGERKEIEMNFLLDGFPCRDESKRDFVSCFYILLKTNQVDRLSPFPVHGILSILLKVRCRQINK